MLLKQDSAHRLSPDLNILCGVIVRRGSRNDVFLWLEGIFCTGIFGQCLITAKVGFWFPGCCCWKYILHVFSWSSHKDKMMGWRTLFLSHLSVHIYNIETNFCSQFCLYRCIDVNLKCLKERNNIKREFLFRRNVLSELSTFISKEPHSLKRFKTAQDWGENDSTQNELPKIWISS